MSLEGVGADPWTFNSAVMNMLLLERKVYGKEPVVVLRGVEFKFAKDWLGTGTYDEGLEGGDYGPEYPLVSLQGHELFRDRRWQVSGPWQTELYPLVLARTESTRLQQEMERKFEAARAIARRQREQAAKEKAEARRNAELLILWDRAGDCA